MKILTIFVLFLTGCGSMNADKPKVEQLIASKVAVSQKEIDEILARIDRKDGLIAIYFSFVLNGEVLNPAVKNNYKIVGTDNRTYTPFENGFGACRDMFTLDCRYLFYLPIGVQAKTAIYESLPKFHNSKPRYLVDTDIE